jgi:hypothetical protein
MIISMIVFLTVGPNSLPLQLLNLVAAVVGITSPILAISEQRKQN